jgi:hypothetical protein
LRTGRPHQNNKLHGHCLEAGTKRHRQDSFPATKSRRGQIEKGLLANTYVVGNGGEPCEHASGATPVDRAAAAAAAIESSAMPSSTPLLTHKDLIAFLEQSVQWAVGVCADLRYDAEVPRDRFAVLLLYAVIEHGRAVLTLAKAGVFPAIAVVTRTALDAHVDIANLAEHPHYWENLTAVDTSKWQVLLQRASRGDNPVLKGISEDAMLPVGRRKFARELKVLRAKGVKELGIAQRFKQAELTKEYESIYTILSGEVHNNISSLQGRYIDRDDESGEWWIVQADETSKRAHHYELACTLTMAELVLRSTELVLRLFGHGVAVVSGPLRELERIWALAQKEEARQQAELAPEPRPSPS